MRKNRERGQIAVAHVPFCLVMLRKHRTALALFAALLLAGSLRFYGLEIQSLWNDELLSWDSANRRTLYEVIGGLLSVEQEVHPPGYFVFLYFIEEYFGESEWVLRFPSAVAGVLSVLVIYLLGRRLYSRREGLIAALLMAVLWAPVYHSQEVRMYSLLLLFTLLATFFWVSVVRALEHESRVPIYAMFGYVLSAAVASYLHYFGLYLIGLQGLWATLLFVGRLRALGYIVLVYALVLLLYLPWLLPVFASLDQYLAGTSSLGVLISPVEIWALSDYLSFIFNQSKALVIVVLALYLFLLVRGVYAFLKAREHTSIRSLLLSPGMLLALWLIVPFAGAYAISVLWKPALISRYLIISLPAAYLLVARSITQLPLRPKVQVGLVTVVIGLLLSHLLFSMNYYTEPHNEQFREAVRFATLNERADSLIVGCSWGFYGPDKVPLQDRSAAKFDYYFKQQESDRRVQELACEAKDLPTLKERIEREGYRYVLYLTAHNDPESERPLTLALHDEFELISHEELVGANAYLYEV